MAIVTEFFVDTSISKAHPTTVECGWQVVRDSERTLLQLSTYGSVDRESHKKVSQTLQLDEHAAIELMRILRAAFSTIS